MKAVVGYSDKTVEQVREEIAERERLAEEEHKRRTASPRGGSKRPKPTVDVGKEIPKSRFDALGALAEQINAAKARVGEPKADQA
jgi:hypothetical protein